MSSSSGRASSPMTTETPVPDWKRREWARDVLAAGDPTNEGEGSRLSTY